MDTGGPCLEPRNDSDNGGQQFLLVQTLQNLRNAGLAAAKKPSQFCTRFDRLRIKQGLIVKGQTQMIAFGFGRLRFFATPV